MRTRYRIERRALLTGGTALAVVAGARVPVAQSLDKVSFQTNWRAQAEHGGYYQAVAAGLYRRHGIDCELRQGGPQQNPAQLLLAGRVDMIMSSGFQALNYVRENLPFLCIAAIMQKDPQVLMSHEEAGLAGFEAMRGRPIFVGAAGRVTYWPFLKARFGFSDDQIRPYTFNIQPFVADRSAIMQGFLSSEPYSAMQAGARPHVHLIADAGYPNYQTTIDIARRMTEEKADLVQRFVDATIEGWAQYMQGRDIGAANAMIMRDNPEMTQDRIDYAIRAMNERGIVLSGDAEAMGIGAMTDARWASFYTTMRDAGVVPAGLDVTRAYSLRFVNKRVGLA
ncbi:ABC transporter substrate-binding protein [Paracraurococcus ruber]|uniref:Nitrate ABC transporter substrate-binding protein n=1 Tax=Paracraurococcus ruber TaxID=77675 RepID=A0ABS1CSN9_9PROT|nr:ABC transporter substrate-binding protein [Paracraurococcus ruber]MBK1657384.1 nitrate ABC transporter substrate-binding protein [Paracraurococcus ruber]TDG32403.1 ABC transporter substrate-binding protein [Paracraurococcus ruber]